MNGRQNNFYGWTVHLLKIKIVTITIKLPTGQCDFYFNNLLDIYPITEKRLLDGIYKINRLDSHTDLYWAHNSPPRQILIREKPILKGEFAYR